MSYIVFYICVCMCMHVCLYVCIRMCVCRLTQEIFTEKAKEIAMTSKNAKQERERLLIREKKKEKM